MPLPAALLPERALPSAVGVIVDNVATAMQAALAVKDDLPCYERIVTVQRQRRSQTG